MRPGKKNGGVAEQNGVAEALKQALTQVEVEPVQTILSGCRWRVDPTPDGGKQIAVIHSSGLQAWLIPLPPDSVASLVKALTGVEIASAVPGAV